MSWNAQKVRALTTRNSALAARHGNRVAIWCHPDHGWVVMLMRRSSLDRICIYQKMDADGAAWCLNHLGVEVPL